MSSLLTTLLISFFLILLALASLAVGWLLTGKQKLKAGACGRDPNKSQDDGCGSTVNCQLCDHTKNKKQENNDTIQ